MSYQAEISFFNTIHLTGSELADARKACNKQEERILDLMRVGVKMTPLQVWDLYNKKFQKVPESSVRRAMTCLTDKDYLVMHEEMRMERYGKRNFLWSKK